ncbi:hypothetical protein [Nocardiopsis alba]
MRIEIEHLPPESPTKTAMRIAAEAEGVHSEEGFEPADAPWSALEMLVAGLRDDVREGTYVLQKANGGKPDKPKPIERPGVRAKKKTKFAPVTGANAEHLFRRLQAT